MNTGNVVYTVPCKHLLIEKPQGTLRCVLNKFILNEVVSPARNSVKVLIHRDNYCRTHVAFVCLNRDSIISFTPFSDLCCPLRLKIVPTVLVVGRLYSVPTVRLVLLSLGYVIPKVPLSCKPAVEVIAVRKHYSFAYSVIHNLVQYLLNFLWWFVLYGKTCPIYKHVPVYNHLGYFVWFTHRSVL